MALHIRDAEVSRVKRDVEAAAQAVQALIQIVHLERQRLGIVQAQVRRGASGIEAEVQGCKQVASAKLNVTRAGMSRAVAAERLKKIVGGQGLDLSRPKPAQEVAFRNSE